MTFVQLLHSRDPLKKVDNLVFLTNNPSETLFECNTFSTREVDGFWDSRAILGPMEFSEARDRALSLCATRGFKSKLDKIQWIALQYNINLYLGTNTPDTELVLEHALCKRTRANVPQ